MKQRIQIIQEQLGSNEAMLVTSGSNRFYLTGFRSSAGLILITKNKADFLIDFRYFERAKKSIKSCDVAMLTNAKEQLQKLADEHCIERIFVETGAMTIDEMDRYASYLPNVEFSFDPAYGRLVSKMRSIKTAEEIENICKAQKITDDTFAYILNRIKPGMSEREIMLDMEFFLRKQGSEGVSFNFIVLAGKNSSSPHGSPSDKIIERGDFITMDFGAVINGYRSDMTRTVAVGEVSEKQRFVYETVLKAQLAAIEAAKPGKICKDIDFVSRSIINDAGFEGCFGHGLGHSVGLDVHESPSFNRVDERLLEPGMVITVEPGIYLEGEFGVRIEDMIAITEDGCKNLTHSPKELIIL